MNKLKRFCYIFTFSLLIIFSSCKRSEPWWDADLVAPIAYSNMTLSNIFADSLLQSNSDSSLKIAFSSELFNYKVDSLINIPDTSTNYYYPFPIVTPYLTTNNQYFSFSNPPTTYNLNGVFLKRVLLRTGKIRVDVVSTVTPNFGYKINVPLAKLNGVPLLFIAPVPGPPIIGDTVKVTTYFDISGYDIDFSGPLGNKTNYVETFAGVEFTEADSIYPGQSVRTTITFQDLVPDYARGYFGTQTVAVGPDTAAFDVFNQIQAGMLNLNDASLNLKITNEFGADLRATVNSIKSLNLNTGTNVTLSGSPIASPFNVTRAIQTGITASSVVPTIKNISLNGSNSNLVSFINNMPGALSYSITAQLNPLGNVSGYNDFAFYGTSLKANMDVDIPLYFSASEITLRDTVDIDLSGVSQTNNINRGTLTLIATNGYPFSLNIQGFLLNEFGQITDSLFVQNSLVDAPALDIFYKVVTPKTSNLYIYLTPEKITKLKASKKIIFRAKFNTASYPSQVKFYNYYKLGLKLTSDINYSINKK